MGSSISVTEDILREVREELRQLRVEMRSFQNRLAGVEKDISSCVLSIRDNSNSLLNISLLEEGRSVYRKPKRHTASNYN